MEVLHIHNACAVRMGNIPFGRIFYLSNLKIYWLLSDQNEEHPNKVIVLFANKNEGIYQIALNSF